MMPGGALAGETTADVRHLKGRQVIEDVADPGASVVFQAEGEAEAEGGPGALEHGRDTILRTSGAPTA
jgi:hypothetical protein